MAAATGPQAPREMIAADLVIRAGRIYPMSANGPVHRALAIRNGSIVGLAEATDGPDSLISAASLTDFCQIVMVLISAAVRHAIALLGFTDRSDDPASSPRRVKR